MREKIKESLRQKSTEELLDIYRHQNLAAWSVEVFEIIPGILAERKEPCPELGSLGTSAKEQERQRRRKLAQAAEDAGALIKGVGMLFAVLLGVLFIFAAGGALIAALSGLMSAALVAALIYGIGAILQTLGGILASLEDRDSPQG
jgi:hypothetical protein